MFELQLTGLGLHCSCDCSKEVPVLYEVGTHCKMGRSGDVFCLLDPDFYSAFPWPFVHNMHTCQVSWQFQNQIFLSIKKAIKKVHYLK